MKRKLLYAVSYIVLTLSLTSCESLSSCEVCKWVTTDSSNGEVTESPYETEYCGAELLTIKSKSTSSGTQTTTYKCH
jgi:hypothetical protein